MGCDINWKIEYKKDNMWHKENINDLSCIGRNYNLFAILADVRNEFNIIPIANRGYLENTDSSDHFYTYHTLKNINDYDWNQIINLNVTVALKDYREWMKQGKKERRPEHGCSFVKGPLVINISNEDMENIINNTPDEGEEISNTIFKCKAWDKNIEFYTQVEYTMTCAEVSPTFYNEIIPKLQELADKYGGDENVRFVFGFNN